MNKLAMNRLMLFIITAALSFSLSSAQAHHSFSAEFDAKNEIMIRGVVVKVEWTNPHTYFYVEAENEKGEIETWGMEMGSPNGLMRRGWTRNTLQIGDEVIVKGTRARDGSTKGNAQYVVIAETCQRLFAGTSQQGVEVDSGDPDNNCVPQ
jgi:hypothetical protein